MFDSTSEQRLHILCDLEDDDQLEEDDLIFPLVMEAFGDILVTSSSKGLAIVKDLLFPFGIWGEGSF